MDITIPPHNLKRFAASITCLGKIGKDLYLSFDPLDGLTLSSLNEAKSAYGKFHFDSGFFERCTAPAVAYRASARKAAAAAAGRGSRGGGNQEDNDDDEFYDTRYVCRVPVRSVHSILRPRKGVCSLRIRSEGMDDEGNYFGLNRKKKKKKSRERNGNGSRSRENEDDDDDENEDRRGSFSARERRSRKRRKQSKLRRNNASNDNDNADDSLNQSNSISQNTDKMMLSFEFFIERPAPKSNDDNSNNNPNQNNASNGGTFRVLHKVGVTDANGITLSASVTQRRTRSEIVSHPKLWLRLLDPLRRTAEVALTIDDELKVVTATSFHPGEVQQQLAAVGGGRGEENAVLQAAAARNAVLKTETSTGAEEFDEYDFRNNRGKRKKKKRRRRRNHGDNGSEEDDESDNESGSDQSEEEDELDFEKESDRPPLDVNQKVILVFSIKEAKAMLQYCTQTNASSYDDEEGVILSFHWGGRPIVIETDGDYFSGELVLATLHHGMIASNITVGVGGNSADRRDRD